MKCMWPVYIYSPTISSEQGIFLHNLYEHINTLNSVYQIVCGDFNCVLDNDLDIISGDQHNARDVNKFNDFVLKSELNDVWRLFNAEHGRGETLLQHGDWIIYCRPTPFSIIFTTVQFIQWLIQITDQLTYFIICRMSNVAPYTGNLTKVCYMTEQLSNNLIKFLKNLKRRI